MDNEAQQIEDGRRVSAFLADDAVKRAFIELEKRYFAEFRSSESPADRDALHARVRALDDLLTTVMGTVNSGKLAQHQRDTREALDARAQAGKRIPRTR